MGDIGFIFGYGCYVSFLLGALIGWGFANAVNNNEEKKEKEKCVESNTAEVQEDGKDRRGINAKTTS